MLATTSVIAFRYKDGIIMSADTGVSYGSIAMTKFKRIFIINNTLITFSGAVSDFLYIKKSLEAEMEQDKRHINSKGIFKLLQLFLYQKRSRGTPMACSIIVAGLDESKEMFLGTITSKGVFWEDKIIATGFASHFALPLLRTAKTEEMTKEEATNFIHEINKVLVYKDCKASRHIQIGYVTKQAETSCVHEKVSTSWDIAHKLNEIKL